MTLKTVVFLVFMAVHVLCECPNRCKCLRYFHFIRCNNASLTEIPTLPNLRITLLDLALNNLTKLENFAFQNKNITKVTCLTLSDNNISIIESDAFAGMGEHLIDLTLSFNSNLQLPEGGFNLESLLFLQMSYCNLKSIPGKFFGSMPDISHLFLAGNKLRHFDPAIIKPGLGLQLEHLGLGDNDFTKLDIDLVVYQNRHLWMDGNPFHCDCDWLQAYMVFSRQVYHGNIRHNLVCNSPDPLHGKTGDEVMNHYVCDNSSRALVKITSEHLDSWWMRNYYWFLATSEVLAVLVVVGYIIYVKKSSFLGIVSGGKFKTLQECSNEAENILEDD